MNHNFFDYRNVYSMTNPSFMNIIKPKKTLTGKILSKDSLASINSIITGAQKAISIYDRAVPIVKQSIPLINNVRTTFKVAKAFKSFAGDSSLEKAFDNLPDYQEEEKKEPVQEKIKTEQENNPFYPKNN